MFNPESTLHKRTVLISTGSPSSPLVRALCEQLTSQHRHYRTMTVALVSNRVPEVGQRFADSVQLFTCDFSKREQVGRLVTRLKEGKLEPLELVIQLDSEEELEGDFFDRTSSEILGFINLLTNFVPLMTKNTSGGRIVSIKNSSSSNRSRAFRDSQNEYNDLVRTILNSEEAPKATVQLSTIFCDRLHGRQSQEQMAQQILQTIESSRNSAEIKLNPGRNLFEFCSSNLLQLATFGLDKLQLRKAREGPLKVQ